MSELVDPTTFLDGGELVLTTGVPFTVRGADPAAPTSIVSRRSTPPGSSWDSVKASTRSRRICARRAAAAAAVARRASRRSRSSASRARTGRSWPGPIAPAAVQSLGAQSRIVRAIASDGAAEQIVRIVAQAVGGWGAFLPHDESAAPTAWPESRSGPACPQSGAEARRLFAGTQLSAATFTDQRTRRRGVSRGISRGHRRERRTPALRRGPPAGRHSADRARHGLRSPGPCGNEPDERASMR